MSTPIVHVYIITFYLINNIVILFATANEKRVYCAHIYLGVWDFCNNNNNSYNNHKNNKNTALRLF